MYRITEKMLETRLESLCKALGKAYAKHYVVHSHAWQDKAWFLHEYNNYWTIRSYAGNSAEHTEFSEVGGTKRELFDQMGFALRALAIKEQGNQPTGAFWPINNR
jgi:hypothetical protein